MARLYIQFFWNRASVLDHSIILSFFTSWSWKTLEKFCNKTMKNNTLDYYAHYIFGKYSFSLAK